MVPRSITIDNLHVINLVISRSLDGQVRVTFEYALRSGDVAIQTKTQEITLSSARRSQAQALLDGVTQDVTATELS